MSLEWHLMVEQARRRTEALDEIGRSVTSTRHWTVPAYSIFDDANRTIRKQHLGIEKEAK